MATMIRRRDSRPLLEGGFETAPVRWGVITTVVAALVGLAAAFAGGYIGASATLEAQQNLIEAEREFRDKARLEKVYQEFVNAANDYRYSVVPARTCMRKVVGRLTRGNDGAVPGQCSESTRVYFSSAFAYQGALNRVYIFGTGRAITGARRVSATLPASLGGAGVSALVADSEPVDAPGFSVAYSNFLDLMCEELRYDSNPKACVE